jgi:uncharacterized protein YbaR (Trm112 family)
MNYFCPYCGGKLYQHEEDDSLHDCCTCDTTFQIDDDYPLRAEEK